MGYFKDYKPRTVEDKPSEPVHSEAFNRMNDVIEKVIQTGKFKGQFEVKESSFTNEDGTNMTNVVVRHGGEALKYLYSGDKLISIKYTTHYFMNGKKAGEREWTSLNNVVMKAELREVYDTFSDKTKIFTDAEKTYIEFRNLVYEHSPKRNDGKSEYYCSKLENNQFSISNSKGEKVTVFLNEEGKVVNLFKEYETMFGKMKTNLVSTRLFDDLKDKTLAQYVDNAILIFNAEKVYVCYNDISSNGICGENTKAFNSMQEAQDFLDNLPSSKYEGYIVHEDLFDSMDFQNEDYVMD